jgi:nucleoside-diphosphate-sugar epimerase
MNLTDKKKVKKLFELNDIDMIIQAAAQIYGVKGFHKYPANILSKDTLLHQNLLEEAINRDVRRMVYISSSMVYERSEKIPVSEDDVDNTVVPLTDYGLSKLVGERLCKAFKYQYGLDYTIWRPFNIITPYEKADIEPGLSHVFADFIDKLLIKKQNPMEIFGDGNQIRCFTWIDDVAKGIANHSNENRTKCETFNLGNPEPITMKELALKIFDKGIQKNIIPKSKLEFKYKEIYKDDVKVRIPSIKKAQTLLNWNPTVKLDEALDICVDNV